MVGLFDYLSTGAQGYLAASRSVGGADTRLAHDYAGSGKVRSLDTLHQLLESCIGILEHELYRVAHFCEVVRRDVGRHTDSDTR